MTQQEAQAEAVRRWGERGEAVIRGTEHNKYYVGSKNFWNALNHDISGWGDSWEAAFADADHREKP